MRLFESSAISRLMGRIILPVVFLLGAGCTSTLNRAITRENPQAIDQFLTAGANVNAADSDGGTPLIYAAQYGDLALIKKLMDRGAVVNATDRQGNSALMYLASGEKCKNDAVAYLLAHGASIIALNRAGLNPLLLAAQRHCEPAGAAEQTGLVTLLLGAGADADAATPTGETALHLAAFAGQPGQALEQLIHAMKAPQALSLNGHSAFTEAARGDQSEAAIFLAGFGFEPQKITPAAPPPKQLWPPILDYSFPIDARARNAFGDYLRARGNMADALANYRSSKLSFDVAVTEYQQAVDLYTAALKNEKAARRGKWASTVALNVLGAGLGVATGVGFYAVPKSMKNSIDEYDDELEREKLELNMLTAEQSSLAAKILNMEKLPEADSKSTASATAPSAPH